MMVDGFLLVLENLSIELVYQEINGRIHVGVHAFDVNVLAAHVHVGLDFLVELVYGQNDVDVDDVVEMAGYSGKLVGYVRADGWGDVEVVTGQLKIHWLSL